MRRLLFVLGAATTLTVLFSSCSVSSSDYRRESETYLESDALAEEAGYRFSDAVCEDPSSQSTGTQFTCRATDNDGDEWLFVVEITGTREITVISGDVIG
ncbi:MAG: hypothetical protein O3C62_08090 [Actinomycetota bacterium]|nr:hypothetical protein [Actinomycetota bacterium]MDA2972088.1 hypothetical protein [Actinomycetota bacterium]MDA3001624.1 hypothetical protein [Actinomycetota bacterium]